MNQFNSSGCSILARLQAQVRVLEAAAQEAKQRAQQDRDQDQTQPYLGGLLQAHSLHSLKQGNHSRVQTPKQGN